MPEKCLKQKFKKSPLALNGIHAEKWGSFDD
jgi:hypothetical protein